MDKPYTVSPEMYEAIEKSCKQKPKAKPLQYFRRTDVGNSQRLQTVYGDVIRYCFSYRSWLIWDGKRWKIDKIGQIIELAKHVIELTREAAKDSEELRAWCKSSESRAKLNSMIDLAQSLVPVFPEDLDADPWLLNVQNGIVDLRTGDLLPHNPEKFMTKICHAEFKPMQPGLWSRIVDEILPNPEVREFIQRFAGYSLTGSVREEKFLVLHGEGGAGKGTVTETLAAAMGEYADTLAVEVLLQSKNAGSGNEPSPELAKLPGVRLLLASETGQGRLLDEARVKAMTGGDMITARRLRCDPFRFVPNFKLWLSTNHVPRIRGQDNGIWRRFRLVPFQQQFKDGQGRDNTLKEKLQSPEILDEILIWAIAGCLQWQQYGLREPVDVIASTDAYRQECDIAEQFISDECETGPNLEAPVKFFYHAFRDWCTDNGHIAGSSSMFSRMLEVKKFKKVKRAHGWFWLGVKLRG